jgi:hypothetical protein
MGLIASSSLLALCAVYYLLAWIPAVLGDRAWLAFGAFLIAGYAGLLLLSLRFPELPEGDLEALMGLGEATPIIFSGLYFLLPTAALVWGLIIMEMSPGLAAYYACLLMVFIVLTQRPFVAWRRREPVLPAVKLGLSRLLMSLAGGAKNMVGIALATATAGIVVGSISLTGVGQVLAAVVEAVSGGYLPAVLVMTALLAILLGMGLPTTANYIIVSTLLAPVIYDISAAHGLGVPLLAVHLFCLYFGVMADATPPVALAAFAASGISGGDPFRTGLQGFIYELRTAVLPFVFLYNQEILLINIASGWHFAWVLLTATLACLAFASATQRFMFTRTRWYEVLALLASMVFLFRPGIPRDMLYAPYRELGPKAVFETVESLGPGGQLRLHLKTELDGGRAKEQVVVLPFSGSSAEERLERSGTYLAWDGDRLFVDDVATGSRLERLGISMDYPTEVLGIEVENARPPKWLFGLPGLFILALVARGQIRRSRREALGGGHPEIGQGDLPGAHALNGQPNYGPGFSPGPARNEMPGQANEQ